MEFRGSEGCLGGKGKKRNETSRGSKFFEWGKRRCGEQGVQGTVSRAGQGGWQGSSLRVD